MRIPNNGIRSASIGQTPGKLHSFIVECTFLGRKKLTFFFRQGFHTDPIDIVGLLCLPKALEGGESDVISGHQV